MPSWFHTPFGHRKKQSAVADKRPPVTIKLSKDGQGTYEAVIKSSMMHTDVKKAILKAIGEENLDIDKITVYDSQKLRLPCSYELFLTREGEGKMAKHKKQAWNEVVDVVCKTQKPWERALDRADIYRFANENEDCGVQFQSPDEIFTNREGVVKEAQTETLFLKARLAGTWVIDSYIQAGSFGRGWNAINVHTNEKVFIKTFRSFSDRAQSSRPRSAEYMKEMMKKQEAAIRKEVEVLLHPSFGIATSHELVVSNSLCYGEVIVPSTGRKGEMFFIMTPDLCEGGELFNYLCPPEPPYVRSFSEATCRRLFRQIASGVGHLHNIGAYHRDLKLENLVVDGEFNVKIMDFGSLKFEDQMESVVGSDGQTQSVAMTYVGIGTGGYKPLDSRQEFSDKKGYDPAAVDVWACGVILFYLCAGAEVFRKLGGQMCFRLIELIITGKQFKDFLSPAGVLSDPPEEIPEHKELWKFLRAVDISDDMKSLINQMLDLDSKHRITMNDVLEHEWFEEEDASNEVFYAEMRSRPIDKGNNFIIPFGRLVNTVDEAKYVLHKAIPPNYDGTPYPIVIHDNEIHIGKDESDNHLFRVIIAPDLKVTFKWKHGNLKDWIRFGLCIKEALGYDTGKRAVAEARKDMAMSQKQ